MKKVLSLVAVAGMFAFASCEKKTAEGFQLAGDGIRLIGLYGFLASPDQSDEAVFHP